MTDTDDVLNIEIGFSMIVADTLVIGTAIYEFDREALGWNVVLLLEELKILCARGLIQEAAESDCAISLATRGVLDIIYLLQTVRGNE